MNPVQYGNQSNPLFGKYQNDLYRMTAVPQAFEADIRIREQYAKKAGDIMKARPGKRVPVSPQELVQWIKNEAERRRTERLFFELQWMLNLAFVEGQQYMYINNFINSLFTMPSKYDWQQRDVYNQMAPIFETTMAKYGRINPLFLSKPQSDDSKDINSSDVSKEVLTFWRESEDYEARQMEANAWSALTGTSVWKTIWNPNKGKKIAQIPKTDKYGNEYLETIREGDIENVVCPPFEILPDSSYNYRIEDCRDLIHAKPVSVDDVFDRFGIDVSGRTLNVFTFDKDYQAAHATNPYATSSSFQTDKKRKEDVVMLYEYYANPSQFYPEGRLVIICDNHNEPLYDGPLPFINAKYGERRLPFDIQRDIPRAGYFWGTCRLDRAIPVQRRYNAIKNRIAEFMNRTAIGVWAIPSTSDQIEDLEEYGIDAGTMIKYTEGQGMPKQINSAALPSTFENEAQNTLTDISRVTGVSELSKDSRSSEATSGRALLVLQEQDETRMSLTAKSISQCQLGVAKKTLYAYKQFASFERMISIEGIGNAQKVIRWKGDDLSPESIYIKNVSALSETLAQKRGFIMDMVGLGAFRKEDGTVDTDRLIAMTEAGETDVDQTPEERQKKRAKEENAFIAMKAFDKVTIDEWEIHEIAYKYHLEFMLSSEYRSLDQQIQQAFKLHLYAHRDILEQRAMMQQSERSNEDARSNESKPNQSA